MLGGKMRWPRVMYRRQKAGFLSVWFFARWGQVVETIVICGLIRQLLQLSIWLFPVWKINVSQSTGYRGSPLQQSLMGGFFLARDELNVMICVLNRRMMKSFVVSALANENKAVSEKERTKPFGRCGDGPCLRWLLWTAWEVSLTLPIGQSVNAIRRGVYVCVCHQPQRLEERASVNVRVIGY